MASDVPQEFLQGDYVLYPKGKDSFNVIVSQEAINLTPNGTNGKSTLKPMVLKMQDVIGADTLKGKTADDTKAYLTIYAYPLKKKTMSKKLVRKRDAITLTFDKFNSYNENWKSSSQWKTVLNCLVRKMDLSGVQGKAALSILVQLTGCLDSRSIVCTNKLVHLLILIIICICQ